MYLPTVLVETSWLHNVWEVFLLFIKFNFFRKNGVLRKLKLIYPSNSPALQQLFSPHLFNFIKKKKTLAPTQFKKEDRDYAFYMRDYKRVTKDTDFYMTDFLFTEL